MSEYSVPAEEIRRELTVSNSRFIATISPVFSVEEAREFVARIGLEFSGASHNVPAYIIGGGNSVLEYCSDDGEPTGTAGRPALAVLRGSGLGDAAVVITRYFGGTLLGKGGLVRAYTEATQLVVENVSRAYKKQAHIIKLAIRYPLLEQIRRLSGKYNGKILDETFAADVTITLQLLIEKYEPFKEDLKELSSGKVQVEILETNEVLVRNSQKQYKNGRR